MSLDSKYPLSDEQIATYHRDGFIQIANVMEPAELKRLRDAVAAAVEQERTVRSPGQAKSPYEQIFIQKVNLWQRHPQVREFVLCKRFGDLAARLSGFPVRVWHDQALFKEPREGAKTPWHQDAYYWPHQQRDDQISIWLALSDATIENGCMSFVPGSQHVRSVGRVDLGNPRFDLFDRAPEFRGTKPRTIELKAGSCTFHNGQTIHYAGPNKSDHMREAFAIIYMPDGTTYEKVVHLVTDDLGLKEGDKLQGERFPLVG